MTNASIHLSYKGVPLDLTLEQTDTAQVEKLIDSLLTRTGWSAPATAQSTPSAAKKSAAPRVAPTYNNAGELCCPTHGRVLKEGKWGLFCSAKDVSGDYCKLKFEG